jgi:hypothetical protein
VLAELGMVFADALADSASHTGPCALSHQELTLGVGLRLPLGIIERAGLCDVVIDLSQPAITNGSASVKERGHPGGAPTLEEYHSCGWPCGQQFRPKKR